MLKELDRTGKVPQIIDFRAVNPGLVVSFVLSQTRGDARELVFPSLRAREAAINRGYDRLVEAYQLLRMNDGCIGYNESAQRDGI